MTSPVPAQTPAGAPGATFAAHMIHERCTWNRCVWNKSLLCVIWRAATKPLSRAFNACYCAGSVSNYFIKCSLLMLKINCCWSQKKLYNGRSVRHRPQMWNFKMLSLNDRFTNPLLQPIPVHSHVRLKMLARIHMCQRTRAAEAPA